MTSKDRRTINYALIGNTNLPPRFGKILFKLFRYGTMNVLIASRVAGNPENIKMMLIKIMLCIKLDHTIFICAILNY